MISGGPVKRYSINTYLVVARVAFELSGQCDGSAEEEHSVQ